MQIINKTFLDKVEAKLKKQYEKEDKHYQGLLSLAEYLTNYYFSNYHNTNECDYIRSYKALLFGIEVLEWLLHNYEQPTLEQEWFSKILVKVEKNMKDIKLNLFWAWLGGKFEGIKKALEKKPKSRTKEQNQMYALVRKYPKYRKEDMITVKEELGL